MQVFRCFHGCMLLHISRDRKVGCPVIALISNPAVKRTGLQPAAYFTVRSLFQPGAILQLPFNFDRAIDGLTKVTLRGGVVGKVTFAVVFVSLALGSVAWTVSNIWLSVAALVMIFTLSFAMLWRLINFADRNPQAALLEGAEFLVHEQIVHASKSLPTIPITQIEQVQPEVIEGPSADPELALIPDVEVQTLPDSGGKN